MKQKMKVDEILDMLGHKVEDKITGFKGTVESIGFDLYGCVQAIVKPVVDKDGKNIEARWFDVNRLKITSKKKVMEVNFFEDDEPIDVPLNKGPAEKPSEDSL